MSDRRRALTGERGAAWTWRRRCVRGGRARSQQGRTCEPARFAQPPVVTSSFLPSAVGAPLNAPSPRDNMCPAERDSACLRAPGSASLGGQVEQINAVRTSTSFPAASMPGARSQQVPSCGRLVQTTVRAGHRHGPHRAPFTSAPGLAGKRTMALSSYYAGIQRRLCGPVLAAHGSAGWHAPPPACSRPVHTYTAPALALSPPLPSPAGRPPSRRSATDCRVRCWW